MIRTEYDGTPKQLKHWFLRAYEDKLRREVVQIQRGFSHAPSVATFEYCEDARRARVTRQLMFQCLDTGNRLFEQGQNTADVCLLCGGKKTTYTTG